MADIFDPLLCDESKDLCFDDLQVEVDCGPIHDDDDENPEKRSEALILFPVQSDGDFVNLVEREREYLPKHDFLTRLRCGDLGLSARNEAFDWIHKAHTYYSFGPLSLCLAVNYLDRFLSICDLPRNSTWAVQLLAVACLSIAAKMEETTVPQSIELQVGDPKFLFGAITIQRMELLVLSTLKWRMNAVTPCSFLEYCLKKLSETHISSSIKVINRSIQLILCIIRGIDFLEFKPSEIAVAVAISVSTETQAMDIDKAISCFIHLEKDKVLKCVEMIKDLSLIGNKGAKVELTSVPQSPSGVLDSAGFSYKSDELTGVNQHMTTTVTNATTTTSNGYSPETKRRKLNTTTSSEL